MGQAEKESTKRWRELEGEMGAGRNGAAAGAGSNKSGEEKWGRPKRRARRDGGSWKVRWGQAETVQQPELDRTRAERRSGAGRKGGHEEMEGAGR